MLGAPVPLLTSLTTTLAAISGILVAILTATTTSTAAAASATLAPSATTLASTGPHGIDLRHRVVEPRLSGVQ